MRRLITTMLALSGMGLGCLGGDSGRDDRFADDDDGAGAGLLPAPATSGSGGAPSETTSGSGAHNPTSGSGGNGCSYVAPNSCSSADTLEEMAGDAGADLRVVRGSTNRFVKVFVAETVSSWVSFPELKLTARLDNSPGMDFDLVVYDGGDTPSCDGESYTLTQSGAYLTATWGDNKNSDDGRWWIFEIRHNAGSHCGSAAEWTLTLASNYAPTCATDGVCTTDDDCVCSDCATDGYCSNPSNCKDDGVCDTYNEGCVCSDCAGTPACL